MKHRISFVWIALFAVLLMPRPAAAAFHLMEIDQVIGGVGGDPNAQAVMLKMRSAFNNVLGGNVRLVVRDAAGGNPVTLSTFLPINNPTDPNQCREILLATPGFLSKTSPATVADFTMTPIPASYLGAGSLTFEQVSTNAVLWRLSWGDGSYTGPNTTDLTNGDGDNSPPFGSPLPSSNAQALRFTAGCNNASTSNSTQYGLTVGAAVFTNNHATSFTVVAAPPIPGLPGVSKLFLPAALGLSVLAFAVLRRRRA